jgi:RNA polymerase sigma factor (sigma-70 family)
MHDVFVKALESGASFHGEPAALGAWLFVIARNTVADHVHRAGRTQADSPTTLERRVETNPSRDGPGWGDSCLLHELLDGLTPLQRQVIVLHYLGGLDAADVARALSRSPDAVRHLEHRALTSIRTRLSSAA